MTRSLASPRYPLFKKKYLMPRSLLRSLPPLPSFSFSLPKITLLEHKAKEQWIKKMSASSMAYEQPLVNVTISSAAASRYKE